MKAWLSEIRFLFRQLFLHPSPHAGRENRTPESSLEDSHVSVYITPASRFEKKREGGAGLEPATSSSEATRSWFPFELTARVLKGKWTAGLEPAYPTWRAGASAN